MSVYTPSQVATQLRIEGSTLRRWARFFATHLSPAAGPGNPRRYTDADLTLLQHVKGVRVAMEQETHLTASV